MAAEVELEVALVVAEEVLEVVSEVAAVVVLQEVVDLAVAVVLQEAEEEEDIKFFESRNLRRSCWTDTVESGNTLG